VTRRPARIDLPALLTLVICAASAAAGLAHYAIDVVGDFALAHDDYDGVAHGSRELVTALGLFIAVLLAARGLRACFAIVAANRRRIPDAPPRRGERLGFVLAVAALSAAIVPAMEWLDGRLAGAPVRDLDAAFGGSIPLGLGTTIVCAGLVAAIVYGIVRWLVGHRDVFTTIIETLLRASGDGVRPSSRDLERQRFAPRRRRPAHALRLSKRGPPGSAFHQRYQRYTSCKGDSREFRTFSRVANDCCVRGRVRLRDARHRGAPTNPTSPHGADR
jgi:hypothetical protein